jgi:hypothetical protein
LHNKQHLTLEGLKQIVSLKASLNKGLSLNLREAFPDVTPTEIGLIDNSKKNSISLNPNWIAGFFNGEGCFDCAIKKSKTVKIGYQVVLRITLVQHSRDALLLNLIKDY